LNPVEGAVGHLYHLLNFFLAQAYLSMLAWCDILRAATRVLNCLPRPQSSIIALRTSSPDELATGKKPDLSQFIAAPGQLMAVHEAGSKSSACVQTARLAFYIHPSGGGSLVRDIGTWRTYVTYHAKPVSSSVNGIAAQAISVSHALNSAALRGNIGFNGASADAVSSSVRELVGKGGTAMWAAHAPNTVALLDPITGLAARLVHVNCDGSLALVPDDAPALDAPGAAIASVPPPLPAVVPSAVARPVIVPDATLEVPARSSAQPFGRLFKAWVRALPPHTPLKFGANPKTGKSAHRFSLYHTTTTVGAYRVFNPASAFVHEDLAFDLSRGHAQLRSAFCLGYARVRLCRLRRRCRFCSFRCSVRVPRRIHSACCLERA
jgi:hypothetical protein